MIKETKVYFTVVYNFLTESDITNMSKAVDIICFSSPLHYIKGR